MEIWAVKDVKDLICSRLTLSCTSYRLFRSFLKAAHTSRRSETNRYIEQRCTADVRHLSHLLFYCPFAPATFILIYFFYPTETNLLHIVLDSLPDFIFPSLLNTLQTSICRNWKNSQLPPGHSGLDPSAWRHRTPPLFLYAHTAGLCGEQIKINKCKIRHLSKGHSQLQQKQIWRLNSQKSTSLDSLEGSWVCRFAASRIFEGTLLTARNRQFEPDNTESHAVVMRPTSLNLSCGTGAVCGIFTHEVFMDGSWSKI